jgi:hypothetical protein
MEYHVVITYELFEVVIVPSYEDTLLIQPQPKKKSALVSYNHNKYQSLTFVAS